MQSLRYARCADGLRPLRPTPGWKTFEERFTALRHHSIEPVAAGILQDGIGQNARSARATPMAGLVLDAHP
jgi:hypothetical protein